MNLPLDMKQIAADLEAGVYTIEETTDPTGREVVLRVWRVCPILARRFECAVRISRIKMLSSASNGAALLDHATYDAIKHLENARTEAMMAQGVPPHHLPTWPFTRSRVEMELTRLLHTQGPFRPNDLSILRHRIFERFQEMSHEGVLPLGTVLEDVQLDFRPPSEVNCHLIFSGGSIEHFAMVSPTPVFFDDPLVDDRVDLVNAWLGPNLPVLPRRRGDWEF